jgi:hypothetical protein
MSALAIIACSPSGATGATGNAGPQQSQIGATADAELERRATAAEPPSGVRSSTCDPDAAYCPSQVQVRVDRSFSPYAIDSRLDLVRGELTRIESEGCAAGDGCDWRDRNGVLHFISGDSQIDQRFLVKIVEASDFVGRPIGALGIGTARRQADVIANVRRFIPEVEIDCNPQHVSGNVGPVECSATLNPGWIQIGFDEAGNLLRVRFDGYQFS